MPAKKKAKKVAKKAVKKAPAKKAVKKPAKKAVPKKVVKKPAPKSVPKKGAPKKAAPKKPAPKKAPAKKIAAPPPPPTEPVAEPAAAPAAQASSASGDSSSATSSDGASEPPRDDEPRGTTLKAGDTAPEFDLATDQDAAAVSLSGLRGKKVVLYFYPRDRTPGCTLEAQQFSELLPEFHARNATVLGVSTDTVESHHKFRNACDLTVKLLADPQMAAHKAYGVWGEKNMYGRKVMGTIRTTFIIDEQGRIAKVWPKVKVADHALDVLNSLA